MWWWGSRYKDHKANVGDVVVCIYSSLVHEYHMFWCCIHTYMYEYICTPYVCQETIKKRAKWAQIIWGHRAILLRGFPTLWSHMTICSFRSFLGPCIPHPVFFLSRLRILSFPSLLYLYRKISRNAQARQEIDFGMSFFLILNTLLYSVLPNGKANNPRRGVCIIVLSATRQNLCHSLLLYVCMYVHVQVQLHTPQIPRDVGTLFGSGARCNSIGSLVLNLRIYICMQGTIFTILFTYTRFSSSFFSPFFATLVLSLVKVWSGSQSRTDAFQISIPQAFFLF